MWKLLVCVGAGSSASCPWQSPRVRARGRSGCMALTEYSREEARELWLPAGDAAEEIPWYFCDSLNAYVFIVCFFPLEIWLLEIYILCNPTVTTANISIYVCMYVYPHHDGFIWSCRVCIEQKELQTLSALNEIKTRKTEGRSKNQLRCCCCLWKTVSINAHLFY